MITNFVFGEYLLLYQYYNFLVFVIFTFLLCGLMLLGGWLLGGRSISNNKHTPFESGIVPFGDTNIRFSIKFYLIAIFFVIFDVEALYLYTWSISIRETGWFGFLEAFLFIFILLISLMYLIKNKVLEWTPIKKSY